MHFWVGMPTSREHGGNTFLDVKAKFPPPSSANTFGGVSGGGLWKIHIFSNPKNGEIDSVAILDGVAFYELDVQNGPGIVRCLGLQSIREGILNIDDVAR
jgi:hypothetical protein